MQYRVNTIAQLWTKTGNQAGKAASSSIVTVSGKELTIRNRVCWEISSSNYAGKYIEPIFLTQIVETPPVEPSLSYKIISGPPYQYQSSAIQAKIDEGCRVFYLPYGTCCLDRPLVFPAGNFTIYGDNRARSLFQVTYDDTDIFIVDGTTALDITSINFHNVGHGGACITTSSNGQLIDSVIDKCWFSGANQAARGIDCLFSTTVIRASIFESLQTGIHIQNPASLTILSDILFSECTNTLTGNVDEKVSQSNIQVFHS